MATIKADQIAKKAVSPRHLRSLEKPSLDAHAMRVLEASSFDELKLPNMKMFCESWPSLVAANSITGITGTIFAQGVWQFLRPGSHVAYTLAHHALGMNFARTGYAAASEYGAVTLSTAMECLKPNTPNSGFVFGLKYDPTAATGKNGWANKHTSGATIGAGETAFFDVGFVNSRKSKASVEFNGIIFYANDYGSDMNGYSITIEYVPGSGKSLEITDEDEEGVVIQLATNGGGVITTIPTDLNALTFEYITAACTGTDPFTETVELTLGEGVRLSGGVDAVAAAKTIGGVEYPGQITYTSKTHGVAGNAITIQHVVGTVEGVVVEASAITITLNYGTSTAASIKTLVDNDASAGALVSTVASTAGLMGIDVAPINLAGGVDAEYAEATIGSGTGKITYTAKTAGVAGNSITVWHKAGAEEAISVVENAIEITLNSGTSTAASIESLVDGTPAAAALVGTEVDTAGVLADEVAATALEGGVDNVDASKLIGGDAYPGQVRYVAKAAGTGGNAITVKHSYGAAESVSVTEGAITVVLNYATSTAATIALLINTDEDASELVTATELTPGLMGVDPAAINLSGGIDNVYATGTFGGDVNPGVLGFTSKVAGTDGNDIVINITHGVAESCTVDDDTITVVLNSGASTAATIAALIAATTEANALITVVASVAGILDDGGNALNDNLLVLRATPGTGAKWKFVSIKNGVTEFEEDTGITIVQSAAVSMRVSYEAGTTTGTLTIEWYVGTTAQTTKTITVDLADITGLMSSIQFCGFYEDTAATANNDVAFSVYNDFFRYYVAVPVIS